MPSPVENTLALLRGDSPATGGSPVQNTLARLLSTPGQPDPRSQAAELEALQQQFGAPAIEQDQPGALSRIIDFLSRPNFALAGAAEEIFGQEPSVTRGVTRALSEIFSGVGDIKGEKRAFGEVMERLGVGTKTLADAFPALEGTWIGGWGSRGAAGLALDIATDPLTYMTFGAGTGVRIATSKGIRFLNRAGAAKHSQFGRALRKELGSDFAKNEGALLNKIDDAFEESFGGKIPDEFIEPGGAKIWFPGAGRVKIPGSDKLGPVLKGAVERVPFGPQIVSGAGKMAESMRRSVAGIFSPEGVLANLPEPMRTRAVRMTNDMFRGSTAHRGHLTDQAAPLIKAYLKLQRADPGIGKRFYGVREGVKGAALKPGEEEVYRGVMSLYDNMGETMVGAGILEPEQVGRAFGLHIQAPRGPGYIHRSYKNAEDLSQYHPVTGAAISPNREANMLKERFWLQSYDEAVRESTFAHEQAVKSLGKGEATRLYPILEPEYDVAVNLEKYIGAHSDALARKAWAEEMAAQFGKQLDELADPDALYDDVVRAYDPVLEQAKGAPSTFVPSAVPLRRVISEGDIEKNLVDAFGEEGARYVAVKSKLTGDELAYLPKAIVDQLESVNSSLFNTKDYKAFGQLLKGFDWLNNNFKWGVYTIWPASATRDAYSNIFLSMLRIGTAALNPKRHIDAVKLMAGKHLDDVFAGSGYTIRELREMSKRFGVHVPGQVFVEQTGKFKTGKVRSVLTEKRALIENEARVMLWMEEIRRGADPRLAADTVGEFLFQYGEVSRVERDLFRRLIPFYTFTRKNVELQAKMLRRNPGMVINQLKPFRGRAEENESMVKWEAEGLKLRLDRDGKTLHVLTGIDAPLRNLDTIWAGGVGATGRRLMGMVTPILKVPIEKVAGVDFFTGRSGTRKRADLIGSILDHSGTPKPMLDWFGYKKEFDEAGRPRYTVDRQNEVVAFTEAWMFSRAFSTSDRIFREYLGESASVKRALIDVLTGLRVKELNMDEQEQSKLRRRIRELEQSLVQRGAFYEIGIQAESKRGELQ